MFHAIARAAKTVLTAVTVGVIAIGLAVGTATVAEAAPKKFHQSEDGLKMMCDRYGGTFSGAGGGAGAMCSWKDGSDTICDKKQDCVIIEPVKMQRDPGMPVLQPAGSLQPIG
jgi:hypothetical protein